MKLFNQNNKGFTLIELLVVIAIIGILASVVLASLNTARQKSRDARRIGDIQQLKLATEMYYDSNSSYPATLSDLVTASLIPVLPVDPSTGLSTTYVYAPNASSSPTSYVLRATLETNNSVLKSDIDGTVNSVNCGATPEVSGAYYYCVQP